jgi:ABC-type sugar transport system ATPase subunit
VIAVKNVSKHFGGIHALKGVSLEFPAGMIHGLVGENGAGKSTLMKILAGVYPPDEGVIFLNRQQIQPRDPKHARDLGIRIIYQELSLVPTLTVAENLFLHRFSTGGLRPVNRRPLFKEAGQLLRDWDLDVAPEDRIEQLPMGKRQMVEIVREVAREGRVLILDEPTSSLTNHEIEYLFNSLKRLKQQQVAIIFISHRLDEVLRIADAVSVLRNGETVGTVPHEELTAQRIIALIVGRELKDLYPKADVEIGATLLKVEKLSGRGFTDVSFELRRGEILGIAGLIGAGRSELLRSLFGLNPVYSGRIFLDGSPIAATTPQQAIRHGLAMLSENRRDEGIFPELSVGKNLILMNLLRLSTAGWLRKERIAQAIQELVQRLSIATFNPKRQILSQLSGGNQQKVAIGRLLGADPRILLLDEPTRGVDVGTKAEIHRIMGNFVSHGRGILTVSSDIPELVGMCDRIIVLHQGAQVGHFPRNRFKEEAILQCALGLETRQSQNQ